MKIRSSKDRIISIAIATAIISTCTIPNVIAESRNDINEPEQTISNSQEEVYITGEIAELRSKYSKTYEQSDGSRIAVMSAAPICFYDKENETWEEYDNRLTYNEETETFESEETGSDMQVSLPKNIDEQNNIEVEADGYTVSITPMVMKSLSSKKTNEKKKIKSVSEKSLKKYSLEDYVSDSVLDGKVEYTQDEASKVEYIFSGSGLKENIIISEAPINKQTYSFRIKAEGLTAKLKKDDTIKLIDKDKKAVFVIPAPYMYDSNFSFSDKIKTTLKKEGTEYILTYMPDHKWLTDEERAYPVTIDPTVDTRSYKDKIVDTSVMSALSMNISKNSRLFAGAYDRNTTDLYIKFTKLPHIDKQWIVSNAVLYLKTASEQGNKINAYKVNSDWDTSSVIGNRPSVDSKILDVFNVPNSKDKWVYWDITNAVNSWYNGEENYGIKLSSTYVTNSESVFYSSEEADSEKIPFLAIKYNMVSAAQRGENKTVDISRAGKAEIDDFSGNLVLSREDIGFNGKVMPVNISMIYNLNNGSNPTFGFGFKTNYNQTINAVYNSGKLQYYEYVCGDGSKVYFDYDEKTGEYTDRSDRGYTLKNNGTKASDYSSIVITDSSEYEYYFDKYGRLIKISINKWTEESAIEIAYVGDYTKYYEIDYIKDGVGRKYDFNYTDGKLTDISYYGNTNNVLKKVTYQYDSGSKLTKVTYPDGESVKYYYGNQCLVSAYNTDDYHVTFNYTNYTSSSKANRVTGIKEYGSQGTKGGDISVIYTPFQTEYINNNTGDTETLVFSNDGDLISTYNSDGYVTVNEYAKSSEAHGVSSLVNTYEHKKSETNLIANGEFESDVSGWQTVNGVNHPWDSQGHPGNSGSVKLVGHPNGTSVILQRIEVSGTKGDTYDIGGWAKANASSRQPFEIWVTFLGQSSSGDVQKINFNPYCTDWQYAMKNVQAESDYTQIQIAINYSGQINEAYFDGIVVYKGEKAEETTEDSSEETTTPQETTKPEPTTVIGSDGSVTTTEENDGVKTVSVVDKYGNDLSNETIIGGVSLSNSSDYTENGNYLKSIKNSLSAKITYGYSEYFGDLQYVKDANGNVVNYTYDLNGNTTKVSQNVSGLSNGLAIENSYSYDNGNRLSETIQNEINYKFNYTEFGLIKSIKENDKKLISYKYNDNGYISCEDYGNDQIVDYSYNNDKKKVTVKQNDKTLYAYNYDEFGNLISIKDNISDRVTNYTTDKDGNIITEETGDVYHKFYSTEDENIEVIGNETKKTKTESKDNQTKTSWTVNDEIYSTYITETDNFGRTTSEKIYRISHDSDGKEVASSKNTVYNKEYSYTSPESGP